MCCLAEGAARRCGPGSSVPLGVALWSAGVLLMRWYKLDGAAVDVACACGIGFVMGRDFWSGRGDGSCPCYRKTGWPAAGIMGANAAGGFIWRLCRCFWAYLFWLRAVPVRASTATTLDA